MYLVTEYQWFYFMIMKFDDALSLYEILRKTVLGTEVNGVFLESVFIAPTDSEQFTEFMNHYFKDGNDAVYGFMNGDMSVYGASEIIQGRLPRVEVINLDYMKLQLSN